MPPTDEILRALAYTFDRPSGGCGNVLVLALGPGRESDAEHIISVCVRGRSNPRSSALKSIPIYAWHGVPSEGGADQELLDRIRICIESGVCDDEASTDERTVFKMRCNASASLGPEWDHADGEQLRLYDFSILSGPTSDVPSALEEVLAAEVVAHTACNQALLYSLASVPVCRRVLDVLAEAPPLTRAVAEFLTPDELSASWPAEWRRPTADGYRPARAATNDFAVGLLQRSPR